MAKKCDHNILWPIELKAYGIKAMVELSNDLGDDWTYLDLVVCGDDGTKKSIAKHRRKKWTFCPSCGADMSGADMGRDGEA